MQRSAVLLPKARAAFARGPRLFQPWQIAGLMGICGALHTLRAGASCLGPSPEILWTFPSDGAVDVPTNAQLLVTSELLGIPKLNGVPLEPSPSHVFSLPELEPHTTYRVTWGDSGADEQSISFTTGDGPSLEPAPEVTGSVEVTRNPADGSRCEFVAPQGCFDTGPPTKVRFDAGSAPLAWVVEVTSCEGTTRKLFWPSECGVPLLEGESGVMCARLQATDGVHFGNTTPLICSEPELPPGVTLPRSSGCVGAWPPEEALTLTAKDGVACASTAQSCSGSVAGAPAGPSSEAAPREVVRSAEEPSGCSATQAPRAGNPSALWLAGALLGLALARRRGG